MLNSNGWCDTGWDDGPEIAADKSGNWVIIGFTSEPLLGGGGGLFGEYDIFFSTSSNLDAPAPFNAAALVNHTIPPVMSPGQSLGVGVTLRNNGNTTWTATQCYSLGVLEDPQGLFGGLGRIALPGGTQIGPGQNHQFLAQITAPASPGPATAKLRMIQEHVEWFGDTVEINITIQQPANSARDWLYYQ